MYIYIFFLLSLFSNIFYKVAGSWCVEKFKLTFSSGLTSRNATWYYIHIWLYPLTKYSITRVVLCFFLIYNSSFLYNAAYYIDVGKTRICNLLTRKHCSTFYLFIWKKNIINIVASCCHTEKEREREPF